MLSFVALSLFLISFSTSGMASPHHGACSAFLPGRSLLKGTLSEGSLLEGPLLERENFLTIVEALQKDKEFQSFLTESAQKRDAVLESKEFQDVVATLQTQEPKSQIQIQGSPSKSNLGDLTLFVSISLGEKALLNLAHEAKVYGATLVLRGFIEGSYLKTVKALKKIIQKIMSSGDRPGEVQGFIIDPELFSLFSVTAVPTYVLSRPFQLNALERSQTPLHDRMQGHVSVQYALEMFAKEGDLQKEAQSLLEQAEKGRSQ